MAHAAQHVDFLHSQHESVSCRWRHDTVSGPLGACFCCFTSLHGAWATSCGIRCAWVLLVSWCCNHHPYDRCIIVMAELPMEPGRYSYHSMLHYLARSGLDQVPCTLQHACKAHWLPPHRGMMQPLAVTCPTCTPGSGPQQLLLMPPSTASRGIPTTAFTDHKAVASNQPQP